MGANLARSRAVHKRKQAVAFLKKSSAKNFGPHPVCLAVPMNASQANLYTLFTFPPPVPSRTLTRPGAYPPPERWFPMGDIISVAAGVVIFALLILYVTGCEKV